MNGKGKSTSDAKNMNHNTSPIPWILSCFLISSVRTAAKIALRRANKFPVKCGPVVKGLIVHIARSAIARVIIFVFVIFSFNRKYAKNNKKKGWSAFSRTTFCTGARKFAVLKIVNVTAKIIPTKI